MWGKGLYLNIWEKQDSSSEEDDEEEWRDDAR